MTDKQIMIDCKYKFQNNEKFEGKPYCTLQNKLCEDLSFACDDNCQVYEDYKQLKRKEQECNKLKQTLAEIKEIAEENIRIADLEGLNGVYRRGLAKQILQKIKDCKGVEDDNRN